jgi:hypothetical protein
MSIFWTTSVTLLALLGLVSGAPASSKPSNPQAPPSDACVSCHADFASVLPKGHPKVQEPGLGACVKVSFRWAVRRRKKERILNSHSPHPRRFTLHLDCTACHTYVPGNSFGLIGQGASWGAPKDDDMAAMKEIFAPGRIPAIPTISTPRP